MLPNDGINDEWFQATRSYESVLLVSRAQTQDLTWPATINMKHHNGAIIQYVIKTAQRLEEHVRTVATTRAGHR